MQLRILVLLQLRLNRLPAIMGCPRKHAMPMMLAVVNFDTTASRLPSYSRSSQMSYAKALVAGSASIESCC